jgi:D-glycero-alpha-D-manno-heptose 1-phosphate guanylyltransferase
MTKNKLTEASTVIILAGGRGTRIAALNPGKPKPMVTVAGEPFLAWVIKRLTREGFTDIILSIGHMADVVTTWLDTRIPSQAPEKIRAHREHQPLGTGGAIAAILPDVSTDYVLILNGDTLLLTDFLPVLTRIESENLDGIIFARSLEDTGRYGRLVFAGGLLRTFEEKKPGPGIINGGVYAFRTGWLRQHLGPGPSSIETDIFPRLLKEGARIGVEITTAPFIDIGTPETLAEASHFILTHKEKFA